MNDSLRAAGGRHRVGVCLLGVLLLAGPTWADDAARAARGAAQLEALDEVLVRVTERAAQAIVLLEVERTNLGPRALSRMERLRLGVTGRYDERYFVRPAGPCVGVVLAPGVVATSAWNMAGDGAVTALAPDGRRLPAERLGRDDNLRVALVRVPPELCGAPLEPAPGPLVAGRALLLVARGDTGEPLVTRGIVSGVGRERGDAFVHSARTSYGNVGGALVDLEGRLLGIAVRHSNESRQGQASGVSFGAPWPLLDETLPTLVAGTDVAARPTAFLGIGSDPAYTGVGARIQRIVAGTAAEKAGIRVGDVIRIFNSLEIKTFEQLAGEIQSLEVGTEIVITIGRGDEELDIRVKLGVRPEGQ